MVMATPVREEGVVDEGFPSDPCPADGGPGVRRSAANRGPAGAARGTAPDGLPADHGLHDARHARWPHPRPRLRGAPRPASDLWHDGTVETLGLPPAGTLSQTAPGGDQREPGHRVLLVSTTPAPSGCETRHVDGRAFARQQHDRG